MLYRYNIVLYRTSARETLAKAGFIRLRTVSKQVPFTCRNPASICNPSVSHLSCLHGLQVGKFTPIYPYTYDLRHKAVAFVGMLPPCKVFKERLFPRPRTCKACATFSACAVVVACPLDSYYYTYNSDKFKFILIAYFIHFFA